MEEKNRSMTDEALSQQMRRHRSGKLAGRLERGHLGDARVYIREFIGLP